MNEADTCRKYVVPKPADVESVEALQEKLRDVQGEVGGRVAQIGLSVEGLATYRFFEEAVPSTSF